MNFARHTRALSLVHLIEGVLAGPRDRFKRSWARLITFLHSDPEPRGRAIPMMGQAELERVRRRDPQALAAFFDHHFGRIYSLAARILGDRAAAQDVTQDVFFRVQQAIDRLDPLRDPGPWLATITRNACRDHWRSAAHRMAERSATIDQSAESSLVDPAPDPASRREEGERIRLVQSALGHLPEELRSAILLRDYQGLSHEDIARSEGISHDAARKRYSRALAELARLLRRKGLA